MKEHALFLQAGFPCKDKDWIQEADRFRNRFEALLAEVIRIADDNVDGRILHSGELTTGFTLPAEQKTQRLSGIPINSRLTVAQQNLHAGTDIKETRARNRTVSMINRRALLLLNGLITFKNKILLSVENGELFTTNYPLLIRHIIREAELYRDTIAALERGKTDISEPLYGTEDFWNRIMMEHALFIRGLLDPSEDVLINTANGFAGDYQKLLALADRPDDQSSHSIAELSLAETIKYREFKTAGAQGILNDEIASIILPLLADHVLREANHYIRILSGKQDDSAPSQFYFHS